MAAVPQGRAGMEEVADEDGNALARVADLVVASMVMQGQAAADLAV